MSEAGWITIAGIASAMFLSMWKIWIDLKAVHRLVNSEMAKAREEMILRLDTFGDLRYAKGLEEGDRRSQLRSADALVAATAAAKLNRETTP